jgi:GNAT superfamily N-acetyltransferase
MNSTQIFPIRETRPSDVAALAQLHVDTFNETHSRGGLNGPTFEVRERQWREKLNANDSRRFTFVVEDEHGALIGFAAGHPYASAELPEFLGALNKIYVLRRYHRLGIGRRLLGHVVRRFLEQGVNSMLLFGTAENPSNGFYEAFGAERLYAVNGEFHGAYGWRDLRPLVSRCPLD